jgi:hypothetical protein
MIEISESDTVPMAEFSLGWRFTTRRADRWTVELLERVRPLSPSAALRVESSIGGSYADGTDFAVTFRSDDPPGDVRQRLRDLPPEVSDRVLVAWDARTALVTDWGVFVEAWDDFCYPASDDVRVVPLTHRWALWYRRYEVIQFLDLAKRANS